MTIPSVGLRSAEHPTDRAVVHTLTAVNSATVQANGPRADNAGKLYLNVQGVGRRQHASYGVIDFLPTEDTLRSLLGMPPVRLRLNLVQSIAPFSSGGRFGIWLASGVNANIEPGGDLRFRPDVGTGGLSSNSPDLGPLLLLRSGFEFMGGATGDVDFVVIEPSAEALALVKSQLINRATIRIVLIAEEEGVAATYSGVSSTRIPAPSLSFLNF